MAIEPINSPRLAQIRGQGGEGHCIVARWQCLWKEWHDWVFMSYSPCRPEHSTVHRRLLCNGCENPYFFYHCHHPNSLLRFYVLVTFLQILQTLFMDLSQCDCALNSFTRNMKQPTLHANVIQIKMQNGCKNNKQHLCGRINFMHV